MKQLFKRFRGTLSHVLPLSLLVLLLDLLLYLFTGGAMPVPMLKRFIAGAVFSLVGMSFISLGADMSLIPMGERIGAYITKTGKYALLIICCLLMGALITVAEPDIAVLATQFPGIADRHIIFTIAAGAGVFLVLGVLRVVKRLSLPVTLAVLYAGLFVLAELAPKEFCPLAFDAGGIATGPILVPFVMSLGIGLATVRGGRSSEENSFGMVALCGLGPVFAILLYGMFGGTGERAVEEAAHASSGSAVLDSLHLLPEYMIEVAFALAPIILFFAIFHLLFLRSREKGLKRIGIGLLYSFIGHTVFLAGVSFGYLPAGRYLGEAIASLPGGWHYAILPIGMIMGWFVVTAEHAVRVLNRRVEEITVGAVTQKAVMTMLSIGSAAAVGIAMLRVLTGVSLNWFLIAGYLLSLILSLIVPKVFTAIAFDSGGVATGALALLFIVPFASGASRAISGSSQNVLTDAFGIIALMAMAPVIAMQVLGLAYKLKLARAVSTPSEADDAVTIIEFDLED